MENHLYINNMFVPYGLAVKLKELGFDEICIMSFNYIPRNSNVRLVYGTVIEEFYMPAPLWQQAFDWLWNKTNKYIIPIPNDDKEWLCLGQKFKTYPEARKACLEKLIELCTI